MQDSSYSEASAILQVPFFPLAVFTLHSAPTELLEVSRMCHSICYLSADIWKLNIFGDQESHKCVKSPRCKMIGSGRKCDTCAKKHGKSDFNPVLRSHRTAWNTIPTTAARLLPLMPPCLLRQVPAVSVPCDFASLGPMESYRLNFSSFPLIPGLLFWHQSSHVCPFTCLCHLYGQPRAMTVETAYVLFYLHFQCLAHNSCSINIWVDGFVSKLVFLNGRNVKE